MQTTFMGAVRGLRPIDLMEFAGRSRALPRRLIDERIQAVSALCGLRGLLHERTDRLPRVLRVRVALAQALVREFQAHYSFERSHSSRDHLPPAIEQMPEPITRIRLSDVACETRLGGLLKHYWRRAA